MFEVRWSIPQDDNRSLDTVCLHVPERYDEAWPETFDTSVGPAAVKGLAAVQRLVARDCSSLLLSGPVGCGKTMLAAIACNLIAEPLFLDQIEAWTEAQEIRDSYANPEAPHGDLSAANRRNENAGKTIERRCPRWVSVPRLLSGLKREMQHDERPVQAELSEIQNSRALLCLDDLGAEGKATEWSLGVLFDLVGTRYESSLPVLVRSNLTASQLKAAGYGRIVSRLADNGILLEMTSGKDYRQKLRKLVA